MAVELTDTLATSSTLRRARPQVVVHCAALTNVDDCERAPARARAVNVDATRTMRDACGQLDAKLVFISTDQLWARAEPMIAEDQPVDPANVYGRSKAAGERVVAELAGSLILRTNIVGRGRPWKASLVDQLLGKLRAGDPFPGFTDVFFTPIDVRLLSAMIIELIDLDAEGLYHLAGGERLSKYEFARRTAERFGFHPELVHPVRVADARLTAERPHEMALDCSRAAAVIGRPMPDVARSLDSICEQYR